MTSVPLARRQQTVRMMMSCRFQQELALARAARARDPGKYGPLRQEARALAALDRTEEIEQLIRESYSLEQEQAPGWLMQVVGSEFERHGRPEAARALWERALVWADEEARRLSARSGGHRIDPLSGPLIALRNIRRSSLRGLGRLEELRRFYETFARERKYALGLRALGMRYAVAMGDTSGALALVDSLQSVPLEVLRSTWPSSPRGNGLFIGAQILALLGRKDEAVAMLRQALNVGWRFREDEGLNLDWKPIRDYPPFQELVRVRG